MIPLYDAVTMVFIFGTPVAGLYLAMGVRAWRERRRPRLPRPRRPGGWAAR